MKTSPITSSRLHELMAYDANSGSLTWLVGQYAGNLAGCVTKDGYLQVRIEGRSYYAHRLVWLYVHGEWPGLSVDHADGDKLNNRLSNLRLATVSENAQNRVVARDNKSGFLGVSTVGGTYVAQIQVDGRHYRLGRSADPKEAHELYLRAKAVLHRFQPTPRPA